MGLIHRRQNQLEQAQQMFQKAIEVDPRWVYSYLNLATLQLQQNSYKDLLQTTNRALELNSALAPAHYFSAMAYAGLGDLARAEKDALAAAGGPDHEKVPQAHLLLARLYERRGATSEALAQLKLYLKENPHASNAEQVKAAIDSLDKTAAQK